MTDTIVAAEPLDLRELQNMAPADRMDALISRPDAREAVRQIAPFSLYHLIREIGANDALELIQMASPEQIQTFIDLDCWKRDRFAEDPLVEWLQLTLDTPDEDFKVLVNNIDAEPLALLLKAHAVVFVVDEDGEIPEEARMQERPLMTLDGVYYIAYDDNEDTTRLLRIFMRRLYDQSRDLAWALLEVIRWEMSAPMEEAAYQARQIRLSELGFVDMDEALAIYAWRDPNSLRKAAQSDAATMFRPIDGFLMPDIFREPLETGTFLAKTLGRAQQLIDEGALEGDMDAFAFALLTLTNKALAAESAEMRNVEATRRVYDRVRGALQIALEHGSGRDLDTAARIAATTHPQALFQVGHSLAVGLARQAHHLVGSEKATARLTLTEETPYGLLSHGDRLLIKGLLSPRPESHTPGTDYTEPFNELIQIERTAARLSQLAFKITATFGLLGLDSTQIAEVAYSDETTPPVEAVTIETLLNTALAQAALSRWKGVLQPLNAEALADLLEGPLALSLPDSEGEGDDLMDAAEAIFLPKDRLDPTAMTIARIVTSRLVGHLIDELSTLNPADLRSGDVLPHHLGDTLLLTS